MLNRQVFADVKPLQPEDGGCTVLVNTIASCGDPGNGRGQNPVVRVIGPGRGQFILGTDRAVQHIHRIVVLRGDGDTGHCPRLFVLGLDLSTLGEMLAFIHTLSMVM